MNNEIYYNEIDPYAAQWIRNLCDEGHLAAGLVDARDIREVSAADVREARRAHFFAGIGVWEYALGLAGLGDVSGIWTGSAPCQPFSVAGKGKGEDDDRHLWPQFRRLIEQCLPPIILGEQIASPAGRSWLCAVQTDLEALGYRTAAADLCAAGVGAPHIRQRLFWGAVREGVGLADALGAGLQGLGEREPGINEPGRLNEAEVRSGASGRGPGRLGVSNSQRLPVERLQLRERRSDESLPQVAGPGPGSGLGDGDGDGSGRNAGAIRGPQSESPFEGIEAWRLVDQSFAPGAVRGRWADEGIDWLLCRDPSGIPRWRPVRSGSFPMVDGAAKRVGRLRAYGNAIVAPLAAEFVSAFIEAL